VYYYIQLVDSLMYILNDIFICIIIEQCSDKEESVCRELKGCQHTITDTVWQMKWFHITDKPVGK
jgi:hypothetical protein